MPKKESRLNLVDVLLRLHYQVNALFLREARTQLAYHVLHGEAKGIIQTL